MTDHESNPGREITTKHKGFTIFAGLSNISQSILGQKGTVEIGGFAVNEMKVWEFADKKPGDLEALKSFRQNPPDVYGFGHTEYLKNVVVSILEDEAALVDGFEGRKSLELVSAIYESIETNKEVSINFVPQECRLGIKDVIQDQLEPFTLREMQ